MMNKIKKKLPPIVLHNLRRLRSYPAYMPYLIASNTFFKMENHRRILNLKNIHQGQRCFIIGSGPSINKMDLSRLKGEITFGHNAFYLIEDRVGFLPTYYVIEDPLPSEDNADEINKLTRTTKIFAHDLKYCLKPNNSIIYVYFNRYYSYYPLSDFPQFSKDILKGVYWGGTVVYMSLQLAFYMGIREFYLVGIDLDYKIPDHATDTVIVSQEQDLNHFHPDYFGPGKRWHQPMVNRMQHSFDHAYKFLKSEGRQLFNATVGGNLKNIPRVSYNSIFEKRQ
ncbi:MAG: 6-hydroxymethylpterin diphosphokinase MptE-like protein [bacterium]